MKVVQTSLGNYNRTKQFGMTPKKAAEVSRIVIEVGGQDFPFGPACKIVDVAKVSKPDFANLGSQDAMDFASELEKFVG